MTDRTQRQPHTPWKAAASLLFAFGLCTAAGRGAPPILDRVHSDPFALRVEELVQDGTPREVAVEQARIELHLDDEIFCLGFTFVVMWCEGGSVPRAYKRINADCLDAMAATRGVTPLTLPVGWAPPMLSPLPTCPAPQVPMWDTSVLPSCAGLPLGVQCLWMYPTSPTPSWGPCTELLGCDCFPELAVTPAALVIECRDPSAPSQAGDPCPNCQ